MEFVIRALIIGIGATAFMDAVAALRKLLFNVPSADYAMVGRWIAHMPRGRFRHDAIASSLPVRGELAIGWVTHYLVGIAFATLLLSIWGSEWACQPTLIAAMIVGIGSVAAPFLIMQPGMGAGIAANRTPRPAIARRRSLVAHTIFGVGLYVASVVALSFKAFGCA